MKTIAQVIVVAVLACGSSCARPDWIDRTLVTVDVTGTWQGAGAAVSGGGVSVSYTFTLEQRGPKVDGSVRQEGWRTSGWAVVGEYSGPIDGTVAGDVLSFRQKNGSLQGEMTVSGDEMSGVVFSSSSAFSRRQITLRRVNGSSGPTSPKP